MTRIVGDAEKAEGMMYCGFVVELLKGGMEAASVGFSAS
jgi:hypothetical protein